MEAYEFLRNRQLLSLDTSLHETAMPNYTWGDLIQLLDDYLKINQVEAQVKTANGGQEIYYEMLARKFFTMTEMLFNEITDLRRNKKAMNRPFIMTVERAIDDHKCRLSV